MTALEKFQTFLQDLFQLELADLDFGIYRLLHLRHREIESFLTDQLPRRVIEAFDRMAGDEAGTLKAELDDLAAKILEDVADDAILETGEVNPDYQKTKVKSVKKLLNQYAEKREKLKSIQVSDSEQSDVFNHLYAFFSRYYDNGDFIPRRRYGARETYAVPYNGEETVFHWANRDQHYVKTGERFRDYAFAVAGADGTCHIRFCLTDVNLPAGNTKGDTRYFFPLPDQLDWHNDAGTAVLPFHYRPATDADSAAYGNLKNSKLQEAILCVAIPRIIDRIQNPSLQTALLSPSNPTDPDSLCILEKRLRHFCKKNTSDYFIHKDLAGFLNRELEFYLKDQVLHLADLEGDIQPRLRILRVIRTLAEEIITFLTQIEEVQKRLFEKRKLVLRTDYIIPIQEIPKAFWPEIVSNPDQITQWQNLFGIDAGQFGQQVDDPAMLPFLESHPTLTIDTACFVSDFTFRLLATFPDLDDAIDGLLIHSENYQGLRFLEKRYAGQVKCIYIDPPYNTGEDGFVYKDNYQHSSWMALISKRLQAGKDLLSYEGSVFVSVSDVEACNLRKIADDILGRDRFLSQLVWKCRQNKDNRNISNISIDHEYVFAYGEKVRGVRRKIEQYSNPDNDPRGDWTSGNMVGLLGEAQRPMLHYDLINPETGINYGKPSMGWRYDQNTMKRLIVENKIIWPISPEGRPRRKVFLSELSSNYTGYSSVIGDDIYTRNGSTDLDDIMGERALMFPKPVRLIQELVEQGSQFETLVLDFFAGTGTTAHAVINLNRDDGGKRKFILVEMADYFDTVLLPRIRKVMYTPEWKDGQPKRLPTAEEASRTPRIVKVLRLESYEDALHNLVTDDTQNREGPRSAAFRELVGPDTYRLSWLVRLPLEANASLLNLDALDHPFDYRIEVLTDSGPKSHTVDLVETFNYLYGLHVERLEIWDNPADNRQYRAVLARNARRQRVLVLWRDMTDFDPAIERRFLETRLEQLGGSFDEMLINSDTATPGFRSLDCLFKQRMQEGER